MIGHVFKYPINKISEIVTIAIPSTWAICDVNCQGDELFLWGMVDIHAPLKDYRFIVYGTGHKIDDVENLFFLKTVHMPDGLVWHVFAVKDEQ